MTEFPMARSKWLTANEFAWVVEIDAIFNGIDDHSDKDKIYLMINFGKSHDTPPVRIFAGMELTSHTASDLLRGLLMHWETEEIPDSQYYFNGMKQGLFNEVTSLCRQTYVELLSLIEFGITQAIRELPELFKPPRGKEKIYLAKTIETSTALGWIPIEHQRAWAGLIELRNALVHRNGISDKTVSYKITEIITLDFEIDKSVGGHITVIAKLCKWVQQATFRWSNSFLEVLTKQ